MENGGRSLSAEHTACSEAWGCTRAWLHGVFRDYEYAAFGISHEWEETVGYDAYREFQRKKSFVAEIVYIFFLSFEVMPSFPLGLDRIKLYSFYKLNELHFFKGKGSPRP